jgi:hypothetical protein
MQEVQLAVDPEHVAQLHLHGIHVFEDSKNPSWQSVQVSGAEHVSQWYMQNGATLFASISVALRHRL